MSNRLLLPAALLLLLPGAGELCAAQRARERRPSPLADSLRQVRKAPGPAARDAFRKFSAGHGGGWKVRYNPRTALPESITGGRTARYSGSPEQAALAFFEENKALLKVEPLSLRLTLKKEFRGVTHLQYQQYKDGVPVEFSYARVHVSAAGEVRGYQGKFEPDLQINTVPAVTEQAAVTAAVMHLGAQLRVKRTELVIYPDEAAGELKLAWKIRGRAGGLWVYYVDAADGSVLYRYDDLRYVCNGNTGTFQTNGTSSGTVYAVSPLPAYDPNSLNIAEDSWAQPVRKSLRDQYFWAGSYSSMTATTQWGDYCMQQDGKVFSSLKGPFFAVANFRGESAHFDNGGGVWLSKNTPYSTPNPYANNAAYSNTFTINSGDWTDQYPSGTFAKVMPRFSAFSAGVLDAYGSVLDEDIVKVKSGDSTKGAYIGTRTTAFYGAPVENPSFSVSMETDASGVSTGFTVDHSKFLVLTDNPGNRNNATGSVVWSTTTAVNLDASLGSANALSQVNAFYHLNAIRRYFDPINKQQDGSAAANLDGQVAVMVHANGLPDSLAGCEACHGMMNAYYDLEHGHIIMGDGPRDWNKKFRSFALDGTIVRHEYIHLAIDRIFPIINFGEFGAISEGISDYLALASFWAEGYCLPAASPPGYCTAANQNTLGNFIGAGEGSARDLSGSGQPTGSRVMPGDWWGEVHEDGMILSQALYKLGNPNGTRYLGTLTGDFLNRNAADVLVFAALFYFPDNFYNFREAMLDACTQLEASGDGCTAAMRTKINLAFADHGIGSAPGGDAYELSSASGMCDTNNGPECAADISSLSSLSATVYPLGDVDYYSLPLAEGEFTARLDLPPTGSEGIYHAYSMFLFDADREYITEALPPIYGTGSNACSTSGPCSTLSPSVTLGYTVPYGGGRYYLVVSAAPNAYYGNSEDNSTTPYTLTLARKTHGTASARVYSALYDNDDIAFDAPYPYFGATVAPTSSTLTGAELVFEYAQLRDHNYEPIALTRTNASGSYMVVSQAVLATPGNTDSLGRRLMSGRVRLQPGFAARYPGVGTVYLEVFGRNHLGHVLSLGVSNPLNLTANRSAATAYNNIITGDSASIIKYEVQSSGNLSVKVYTQSGSLVKTVYDGPVSAGKGTVDWDGRNSSGGKAGSGIYFVKTKGPGLDKIVKIAVIR